MTRAVLRLHPLTHWNSRRRPVPGPARADGAAPCFSLLLLWAVLSAMLERAGYARGHDVASTGATQEPRPKRFAAWAGRCWTALASASTWRWMLAPLRSKLEAAIGLLKIARDLRGAGGGARDHQPGRAADRHLGDARPCAASASDWSASTCRCSARSTTLAVALILVIVVAKHFGKDVTSLIAALGVGSLAIGLAIQQTLRQHDRRFHAALRSPAFRVGDRIQLVDRRSRARCWRSAWRSTQHRAYANLRNLLIVPNAELVNSRVVNFHFPTLSARGEVRAIIGSLWQ